jgi:hypothetical protein
MKSRLIMACLAGALLGITRLSAQDQVDALRFSQKFLVGDARSLGSGNAFGALGANFISSSINPAGLAVFRKSEFTFGTGFTSVLTKSKYLGDIANDRKFGVNIPELGLVAAWVRKSNGQELKEGWISFAFGLGTVRTNNYNCNRYFEGLNTNSSVLWHYAESANGVADTNLSMNTIGGLAWKTWLINPDPNNPANNTFVPAMSDSSNLALLQKNSLSSRGSAYDINISFAGNYSDFFLIGASLIVPTLNYHETREFTEINQRSSAEFYRSSTYNRTLDVSGVGVGASLGILIKPVKFIRLGGSIQSPSYYSLHSKYSQEMKSDTGKISHAILTESSDGSMDFSYTSPFRASGNLAFLIGKIAFISFDYEMVDYSQSYFGSDSYSYKDENKNIRNYYDVANNFRFGAELKLDIFALRAGYAIYGSPYKSSVKPKDADGSSTAYSAGFGIREKNYFIDLAYQYMKTKEFYLPYSLNSVNVEGATNEVAKSNIVLTFGVRF